MATRRSKGTIQNIVEAISELLRQPLSDESNEVPATKVLRRSKRVAAGKRVSKKARPPTAKARTKSRAKKPATRKKTASRGKAKRSARKSKKR